MHHPFIDGHRVRKGMRACPNNPALETAMDKLVVEAGPLNAQFLAEDALHLKEQMEETRRIANAGRNPLGNRESAREH